MIDSAPIIWAPAASDDTGLAAAPRLAIFDRLRALLEAEPPGRLIGRQACVFHRNPNSPGNVRMNANRVAL